MITEKMREEFEAAFVEWEVELLGEGFRSSALYMIEENTVNVRSAWWAWQASRAAIEVELPSAYQNPKPYACYEGGWNDMRGEAVDNIESLGLKVKPC